MSTFLSLFQGEPVEVAVSQSFQDGNDDVAWHRGAVMTAKEEGLWTPQHNVTAEDIRHMQSRVVQFRVLAKLPALQDTSPCPVHMAQWIRDGAVDEGISLPAPSMATCTSGVSDFSMLVEKARLPADRSAPILRDLVALGAVSVRELELADWRSLPSWEQLRPLEQRRLLAAVGLSA